MKQSLANFHTHQTKTGTTRATHISSAQSYEFVIAADSILFGSFILDTVINLAFFHSYMIGCQGYPRCRSSAFFPKFVTEAAVHESVCQKCRPGDVHKIRFKFLKGSVPPMMPLE